MNTPEKKPAFRLWSTVNAEVLCCAVRYALGRQSYIVKVTTDEIKPLLPYLPPHSLYNIRNAIQKCTDYGDVYDYQHWKEFLCDVTAAVNKWRNGETAPPRPAVDVKSDSFGLVLCSAVRYSLSYDTYAENTTFCLSPLLPYLSDGTIRRIRADVKEYPDYVENKETAEIWKKFLSGLNAESERRHLT